MIKDTCKCGAEFEVAYDTSIIAGTNRRADSALGEQERHNHWLDAHKTCREGVPYKCTVDWSAEDEKILIDASHGIVRDVDEPVHCSECVHFEYDATANPCSNCQKGEYFQRLVQA